MVDNIEHEDSDVELASEESLGSESEWSEENETPAPGCAVPTQELSCSENTIDWILAADRHAQLNHVKKQKESIIQTKRMIEMEEIQAKIYELRTEKLELLSELYELGVEGAYEALRAKLDAGRFEIERIRKEMRERAEQDSGGVVD